MNRRIRFVILALLSLAVLLVCGYYGRQRIAVTAKRKEDFEQLAELIAVEKSTPALLQQVLPSR